MSWTGCTPRNRRLPPPVLPVRLPVRPALPKNGALRPPRPGGRIERGAMPPSHPPVPALAGRRADAGSVRLTGRDITGLMLCAEHFGAPYDLLAAALNVRADRLRGIVARWRHAGCADTG